RLAVDVAIDAGAQIAELTGGTAEAVARREFSGGIVTGAAAITGAAELAVTFPPGALAAGTWLVQVRVTVGGETQTVFEDRIAVAESLAT
ncbi:hypothetical protein, partial [Rhodovulum viride]|uniref:hypothetical protein n=1 Tax=Rhodovulum viride TaxID=1231134 RepID=UPI0015ECB799